MTVTITVRIDMAIAHALDVLMHDGASRDEAVRQAIQEQAARRVRATERRRAILRTNLGDPDGVNIADELSSGYR
jgi:Arc/MetJ-type ribon-helix-helix transcriptional regulator